MNISSFLTKSKSAILRSLPKSINHCSRNSKSTNENFSAFEQSYLNFDLKAKFNKTTVEFNLQKRENVIKRKYPNIWLRDLCQCPECFNKKVDEKTLDLTKTPLTIEPINFSEINDDLLKVTCN
jgi:hypothetical protein